MPYRVVTESVPAPAAGADWSFVPSSTDRCALLAVTAQLATAVAVANRRPALAYTNQAALVYWSADAAYPQTASLAVTYSWARGAGAGADPTIATGERVGLPLPWIHLEANDKVGSLTAAIAAADQWSNVVYRAVVGDWWEYEREVLGLVAALAGATGG